MIEFYKFRKIWKISKKAALEKAMERFFRLIHSFHSKRSEESITSCNAERSEESILSCHSERSEESILSCHSERSEESRKTLSQPFSSGFFAALRMTGNGNESLHFYFSPPPIYDLLEKKEEITYLSEKYLNNEFSLFGSDWKKVHLITENNEKKIDWHYDILTDFMWDSSILGKKIELNQAEGIDIKNIWELGRMQHLLIFPYASILAQKSTKYLKSPNVYFEAFQKQILDFIQSNKYNYGVHWSVAMEVAIRAVNWLLAYDFYKNANFKFTQQFNTTFSKSLLEHLVFICENLEWSNGIRGNHYLANIVGMLFLSAYLPINEFTNKTLFFAIQELCNEILYQFNEDGSNFEGSTCYHYFSTEILLSGLAIALSLKEEKIKKLFEIEPCNFIKKKKINSLKAQHFLINEKDFTLDLKPIIYERINRIFDFSFNLLKNDGRVEQIGDNDSGFFASADIYSFLNIIINQKKNSNFRSIEYKKIPPTPLFKRGDNILSSVDLSQFIENSFPPFSKGGRGDFLNSIYNLIPVYSICNYFKNIQLKTKPYFFYKDFGIYIKRTETYFATIRCGNIGQKGKGGHSHNDQLSFTLNIFGKDIIADPGTFSYTGYPKMRNLFRSTAYHNTLSVDGLEQNEWAENNLDDLFWLKTDRTKAKAIEYTNDKFVGEHCGFGEPHQREIHFFAQYIEGTDICKIKGKKKVSFHLSPDVIIESCDAERSEESRKVIGKTSCHSERSEESHKSLLTLNLRFFTSFRMTDKQHYIEIILTFSNGACFIEDYYFSPGYNQIKKSKRIVIEFDKEKLNWKLQFCKKEKNV